MAEIAKDNYELSEVLKIVNKAVSKFEKETVSSTSHVFDELRDLARLINGICHDGEGQAVNAGKDHISKATSELKQVTAATEEATGTIMDACDRIQELAGDSPNSAAILDEINKIFEACSFQDLTGQRITNAVNALYEIEKRVDSLLGILSGHADISIATGPEEDTRSEDRKLMNGPQMPGAGVTQDDIDRLLNE